MGLNVGDIMSANGLKYRVPQALSSGVSRNYKKEYAQKGSYSKGQTLVVDWNTGTQYVSPETALLGFSFNITQTAVAADRIYDWSGSLGAAALFREIRIIYKNGVEIDRIQDAAQLAKIWVDYHVSDAGKAMLEMAQGFGENTDPEVLANATSFAEVVECVIPLRFLSGFFRPKVAGMLIPAGMASGLRIEIQLVDNPSLALIQANGAVVTDFSVSDAVMLLECTELNDPTQGALMAESSSNGLEYTFPSYYSTQLSVGAGSNITTQVNKAVSLATRMFLACQPEIEAAPADEIKVDSYASIPGGAYADYQFRVGSYYFPNQVVTKKTEKLAHTQAAWAPLTEIQWAPNRVDYDTFFLGGLAGGAAVVCTSLETAGIGVNLSGLPLNNSSTGEVRFKNGFKVLGVDTPVRGVLFLEFLTVANCSLNRTVIKI